MQMGSFRDQSLRLTEWIVLIACYLVPLLSLPFLLYTWLLYPLFALIIFLTRPRAYLVRFHLLQGILTFLAFVTLLLAATLLGTLKLFGIALILFWLAVFGYIGLILLTLVLFCFRRSLRLPLIGTLADQFASQSPQSPEEKS